MDILIGIAIVCLAVAWAIVYFIKIEAQSVVTASDRNSRYQYFITIKMRNDEEKVQVELFSDYKYQNVMTLLENYKGYECTRTQLSLRLAHSMWVIQRREILSITMEVQERDNSTER